MPQKNPGLALYDLAGQLGVGIGEACDRAGIARSTPPRWKQGSVPRPQQVAKLRRAILAIAASRGDGASAPTPTAAEQVLADVETIKAAALRIEAILRRSA